MQADIINGRMTVLAHVLLDVSDNRISVLNNIEDLYKNKSIMHTKAHKKGILFTCVIMRGA